MKCRGCGAYSNRDYCRDCVGAAYNKTAAFYKKNSHPIGFIGYILDLKFPPRLLTDEFLEKELAIYVLGK